MTKERALMRAKQYRMFAEKRKEKGVAMQRAHSEWTYHFDFTEPVKIGHHSEKRHRKMFDKRDNEMRAIIENDKMIARLLEKADNLEIFANRNKGDAENKRQVQREIADESVKVGMVLNSVMYGYGEILKINTKTYTMKFPSGFKTTIDKSWIQLPVTK